MFILAGLTFPMLTSTYRPFLGSASTATMVGWQSAALRAGATGCDQPHSPVEVTRRAFVMKPES